MREETDRDERVWRGASIGAVLGHWRRRFWFFMEWVPAMRGQIELPLQGKRRLHRMSWCFHDECGFANCAMFGLYHVAAGMWRCEICCVLDGSMFDHDRHCEGFTKRKWNPFVRGVAKSRRCGWRCQDRRVDVNEWRRMTSSAMVDLPERYKYRC